MAWGTTTGPSTGVGWGNQTDKATVACATCHRGTMRFTPQLGPQVLSCSNPQCPSVICAHCQGPAVRKNGEEGAVHYRCQKDCPQSLVEI